MFKSVVLDFGHGGLDKDGNYTTAPNKMHWHSKKEIAYEGVFNRQIGGMIHAYLRTKEPDVKVVTTVGADDPRDLSLAYRVGVANKLKADETIFVSVHSNASKKHNARGFEIYTTRCETRSDSLATSIGHHVKELYTELKLKLRFEFEDGDLDKEGDFYVLRKTKCPAVLLECLFFDQWDDYSLLKDAEFQKNMAWKVYKGIIAFIDMRKTVHQ